MSQMHGIILRLLCCVLPIVLISAPCAAQTPLAASPDLASALETITDGELLQYVTFLADDAREGREAGQAGGQAAGDFLIEEMRALGVEPAGTDGRYVQAFRDGMRNILGIIPGADPLLAREMVVVGAHYDHVGVRRRPEQDPDRVVFNGANDNASGVAGVLEIAEAFSQLSQPPRRSILIALWDGEEKGLLGSKHFVEHPTVALRNIVFALSLDMIGRVENDQFVLWGAGTATGFRELTTRHNTLPDLKLEFREFTLPLSDHYPFYTKQIPAVLPSSGIFPELHRPTDDVELINPQGMRRAAQLVFGLVHELANRDERMPFLESEVDGNTRRTAELPAPQDDDLAFSLGFSCRRAPREPGVAVVTQVMPDTPAAAAGLQAADRIHRVADHPIPELDASLTVLVDPGSAVALLVERDGRFHALSIDPTQGVSHAPDSPPPASDHSPAIP
jgi:hypothetical protein